MSNWRLGALATTLGLGVFVWGVVAGGSGDQLVTRILAWPRSGADSGASYAVQLIAVGTHDDEVQSHVHLDCLVDSAATAEKRTEPLETDESGYLMFSAPGALPRRRCTSALGSFAVQAPAPPVGTEQRAAPVRARCTGVANAPEIYFEQPELTIGADSLAWLALDPAHAENLIATAEPGLEARIAAPCSDGFALQLRPTYHVTSLGLEWGAPGARQRLQVTTPVSRGGPVLNVSTDPDGMHYAHMSAMVDGSVRGWLALFDANGLISSAPATDTPWPLPRATTEAILLGARGSFFDSARTLHRVPLSAGDTCARARTLAQPWPMPHPAIVVASGVEDAHAQRSRRAARGRRTAGFGLAGGLVGLAAALVGVRNARITARALAAFGITLALFGLLATLLYAT